MNPPKPTQLRIMQGNPGKRPLNKKEPIPPTGLPDCPTHLMKDAKAEWRRMVPILQGMGLLSTLDMAALAAYCQAYGRWQQAEREMKRLTKKGTTGLLIKTMQGNYIQNPLLGIVSRNIQIMRQFITEFGLSPSSRSRIQVDQTGGEEDSLAKWEGKEKHVG
jgi:P27 family predicted phage terminase small subunit